MNHVFVCLRVFVWLCFLNKFKLYDILFQFDGYIAKLHNKES